MRLNTDGLIIREQHIGENDRLITILTREKGVVRAFASGARGIKSKLASATQLLCYANLSLFRSKDTYRVNEAQALEVFFKLRGDIEKLSLAQYFCELAGCLAPEEDTAEDYLRLMLNALQFVSDGAYPTGQVKSIVELRMLTLAGYMPDLTACAECGQYEARDMFLDCASGRLFCGKHCPPGRYTLLSAGVLAAMRHIVYADFSRLFFFTLPEQGVKELCGVCEQYLRVQLERSLPTLEFYHSLFTGGNEDAHTS